MARLASAGVTVRAMGPQPLLSFARRWRARPDAALVDAVLASLLLAASLTALATLPRDDSAAVAVASCLLLAGAVALRRRMPIPTAVAALIGLVAYEVATHDPNGAFPPVAVALTFYTVGRSGAAQRHRMRAGVVTGVGLAGCAIIAAALHSSVATAVSSWIVVVVVPLAVGVMLARRGVLGLRLAVAAAQLRAEHERSAERATAEERNRVARDLHDVVAHCVSVMVVQAGAARLVAAQNPADADQALAVIGGCGRDALADLRRIVGVLRRDTDPEFGCGAGLADLERLAERIGAAGVPTNLSLQANTWPPAPVDVVAYRVAQEALTNVVKHAGTGATAQVRVTAAAAAVTVEVTNTAGVGPPPLTRHGHGLIGMRERVAAYAGDVTFGPTPDGGYAVYAEIPLRPTSPARGDASGLSPRRIERLRQAIPGWVGDAVIVIGWLVAMEVEAAGSTARRGPWILNATAVAGMALAAGWRRRSPLLFLALVGGLAAVLSGGLTSLDRSSVTGLYCLAVPLFTVAAWQPRARAALGLALWTAGASVLGVAHHAALGGIAGALAMAVVAWTAGRSWRTQRILTDELTETTAELAAERDQRAEHAVATERIRIARELHGLVAHGVVAMVVQAEAARNLLIHDTDRAEAAVRAIEQTGRDALTQLRRILGVLRSSGGAPASLVLHAAPTLAAPQPSVNTARLPEQALA